MPLQSNLFKGDHSLEKTLILDSAHVLPGAKGEAVNKIQLALIVLDNASISRQEILDGSYGRSTAAAVLAYKSKRRIINFSYQKQADNIVGKMTIANLDQEMSVYEQRSQGRPGCCDEVRNTSGSQSRGLTTLSRSGFSDVLFSDPKIRLPVKSLSFHWQHTRHPDAIAANAHLFSTLVQKGIQLLLEFNMRLASSNQGFLDTVPHTGVVNVNHSSADVVRTAAEQVTTIRQNEIRIIVCPFPEGSPAFAFTSGRGFDSNFQPNVNNYILINARKQRQDRCTLIHEMIHAATNLGEDRHDSDDQSVFSVGSNRTGIRREHALALNRSFFAN